MNADTRVRNFGFYRPRINEKHRRIIFRQMVNGGNFLEQPVFLRRELIQLIEVDREQFRQSLMPVNVFAWEKLPDESRIVGTLSVEHHHTRQPGRLPKNRVVTAWIGHIVMETQPQRYPCTS